MNSYFEQAISRLRLSKINKGKVFERTEPPHWDDAQQTNNMEYPPRPQGFSKKHWYRGLHPSPLPSLLHLKHTVGKDSFQQLPTYFDELFHALWPFSSSFTFFSMLTLIKTNMYADPNVIRTRSLLIWSQTRHHCTTESACKKMWPFMEIQSETLAFFIKGQWNTEKWSKLLSKRKEIRRFR